ncbi:MAG: hypothetical protein D6E12_18905 [Desulfovibrio sp.]|nr:MAG: hypothetical protein D6E12_18905 [Desulfovibrio sp.]
MKKGTTLLATLLALLLMVLSLAAEAAACIVDSGRNVRGQADIDSGMDCPGCTPPYGHSGGEGEEESGDGNVIIFE